MSEEEARTETVEQIDRDGAARQVVDKLVELMGLEVEVAVEEQEEQVDVQITGTDAASLVGKKGKTLDALQFIVNKIVSRQVRDHKLVVLDADSYRQRREASLTQLAQRLGEKALDEGKIVRLNPLSARDRRIIHITLRDVEGLSTRSEGDGEERRLLIVPEL